jgi:hypothetical protein
MKEQIFPRYITELKNILSYIYVYIISLTTMKSILSVPTGSHFKQSTLLQPLQMN